jgi:predicted metalloprotease
MLFRVRQIGLRFHIRGRPFLCPADQSFTLTSFYSDLQNRFSAPGVSRRRMSSPGGHHVPSAGSPKVHSSQRISRQRPANFLSGGTASGLFSGVAMRQGP